MKSARRLPTRELCGKNALRRIRGRLWEDVYLWTPPMTALTWVFNDGHELSRKRCRRDAYWSCHGRVLWSRWAGCSRLRRDSGKSSALQRVYDTAYLRGAAFGGSRCEFSSGGHAAVIDCIHRLHYHCDGSNVNTQPNSATYGRNGVGAAGGSSAGLRRNRAGRPALRNRWKHGWFMFPASKFDAVDPLPMPRAYSRAQLRQQSRSLPGASAPIRRRPGPAPEDLDYLVPLGSADVKRPGTDMTVVATGRTVPLALAGRHRPWPGRGDRSGGH